MRFCQILPSTFLWRWKIQLRCMKTDFEKSEIFSFINSLLEDKTEEEKIEASYVFQDLLEIIRDSIDYSGKEDL